MTNQHIFITEEPQELELPQYVYSQTEDGK